MKQTHRNGLDPAETPFRIAVIGVGCRFPGGVTDANSYWELLSNGRDAITTTPESRWNLQKFFSEGEVRPGKTQSQWGGYVNDIDSFDPQVFGISPREAASMDPQQRLLMESAWCALEDSGTPVEAVAGEPVSVFIGISSIDYSVLGLSFEDRGIINPYTNTGSSSSIAANRISYCFDLRGPSVAVDTACSSSLVAVHMACESIARGDAKMSLVGGVNALVLPDYYVAFSQLGVLSPDGRCKTFDARANGYVRAEGAGVVLLKPLDDAMRDGDRIYAVIRATALNQDGRTDGMTVPSSEAQARLLRDACSKAKVAPEEIQYVEAHGTGTPVGDPIEANALASVLCADRPADEPCVIGSVKTNIGHLEAGAGIASLIKVSLALHHRRIPAHLNFQTPNPQIDLAELNLRIPTETEDWQCRSGKRLAGINGFGYGGANAHVVMEEAPRRDEVPNGNGNGKSHHDSAGTLAKPILLPISARSDEALIELAGDFASWLQTEGREIPMRDIAAFAAQGRSHHEFRSLVAGHNKDEWIEQLREFIANPEACTAQQRLRQAEVDAGVLFVCSGQGPQWWAMGRKLYEDNAVFRAVIERCDRVFQQWVTWSLCEEMQRDERESRLQQTSIAQPCIFALQVALAEVWASRGIKPAAVVGHSVGEIAAAHLSGGLSFEDACCVAVHRGRTMDQASSRGAMIAAGLSPNEAQEWIDEVGGEIQLAAINGPSSVTISGFDDAIGQLADQLEAASIFCRRLRVEYAFHSPQMEPVRPALLEALARIQPRPAHTPMISTVTGSFIEGEQLGGDYWWQNVRQSVRFFDAMSVAGEAGFGVALEIGPHPVLAFAITECYQQMQRPVHCVPSLHRDRNDNECMLESIRALYSAGVAFDWEDVFAGSVVHVDLPQYPFQKQHCWNESLFSINSRLDPSHPLLGDIQYGTVPSWLSRVELESQRYLADHCVRGICVFPAAGTIEILVAASRAIREDEAVVLRRVQLLSPCNLSPNNPLRFETTYDENRRLLETSFRKVSDTEWQRMAQATISADVVSDEAWDNELDAARKRCQEAFTQTALYEYCTAKGLEYESRFRGVQRGVRRDGEAIVEIDLSAETFDDARDYFFNPAFLDSCFHSIIAADDEFDHTLESLYLPNSFQEIRIFRRLAAKATVHARITYKDPYRLVADLDIVNSDGELCALIRGFESRSVGAKRTSESVHDLVYRYEWKQADLPRAEDSNAESRAWCLFADARGVVQAVAEELRQRGDRVTCVRPGAKYCDDDPNEVIIDPEDRDDYFQLFNDQSFTHIVYLWGIDAPRNNELSADSVERSTAFTALAPLHIVQAWELGDENRVAQLSIVTSGAQSPDASTEVVCVSQGPLIGFGRVVVSESSRLNAKIVDLPPVGHLISTNFKALVDELCADDDAEDEIMYRDQQRFVRRFTRQYDANVTSEATQALPARLTLSKGAGVDGLEYRTLDTRPLQPGEIEIEVAATGLNFSDVMKALDLYPGLPDGPVALGAECSGRVRRVADDVSDWNIGDRVMAVAPGAFATHVVVQSDLVARVPNGLTDEQAATIPIAFLTAYHALHECARIREGESVLIHSASGGVGIAATQLAQRAKAEMLATAGTDEKREFVRQLGIDRVMDSRSLRFGQRVRELTNGAGVDVVLNSLPGEALVEGIGTLRIGGRFLEIGKRDIYADAPLGLYPFRNNLAFFAIDLDQLFKEQPKRMGRLLRDLVPRFESGELKPLRTTVYPATETQAAYRFMRQGQHIGKVVVKYDARPQQMKPGDYDPIEFRADGTYWLAGGLGGFGLHIARWMVSKGARHLVLGGRSQNVSDEAQATIDELRAQGATVEILPTDITKPEAVRDTLAKIQAEMPRLRGVIHTAMVLEDRLMVDLDRDTLERVLRPKVVGGWNLHRATESLDLDYFVLFSSLSSVFGHAGQANYSAANAALDSLAHYRRAQGLPALVVNWGHVGEVGYLARRSELSERLERQGVLSFSAEQATECLEYAMQTHMLQVSVLRMDWSQWRGLGLTTKTSPRFAHLLRHRADGPVEKADLATIEEIRAADDSERLQMVRAMLTHKTGSLLGIEAQNIDLKRPLLDLGLDSLMAVELRNWIESKIQINLPISALMRSGDLDFVVHSICEVIAESPASESNSEAQIGHQQADQLLKELSDLSEEQVSSLLTQMLRE